MVRFPSSRSVASPLGVLIVLAVLAAITLPPPAGARQDPAVPAGGPAPATASETDAADDVRPRVLVHLSREQRVIGTVELEDDDVLVVRTHPRGEVRSFLKSRVIDIVRFVDPAPGQRGTVVLRGGQAVEGVVIEDGFDGVVMIVEGITMVFPRDQVERVKLAPTFEQRYAEYKAALGRTIGPRHIGLIRWLMEERRYQLAREEVEALLDAKPDLDEARRLRRIIDAQLALGRDVGDDPSAPPSGLSSADPNRGPVDVRDMLPDELLSAEDVNIIRVYEIAFDDPPEVHIGPDTIRTLLERYGSSNLLPRSGEQRTALFRADPIQIVRLMFDLRARELYPQIEVLSEPRALNLFRQRVHNTWLVNSCATSRCHGGPFAGRFFLHRRNYRDERVRFTNLLILERLDLGLEFPLVNYDVPMDSLIIQYGLPREVARLPHPEVRGWKPVFTRGNQRLLRYAIDWIDAMMTPRPIYPVDYEPPVLGGRTPGGGEADPGSGR